MRANEREQADSLWLRLQVLLSTDGEVIHSDQIDVALFFKSIDCTVRGGTVVCSEASQQGGSRIELQSAGFCLCCYTLCI